MSHSPKLIEFPDGFPQVGQLVQVYGADKHIDGAVEARVICRGTGSFAGDHFWFSLDYRNGLRVIQRSDGWRVELGTSAATDCKVILLSG